ncbi:hypothetical protein DFS34DRAFT_654025 [Phlyctochytrium arcticum]|nr:hypothetical protein DFS34DRAFT_654025 [Phlyctochytrium arcticum]
MSPAQLSDTSARYMTILFATASTGHSTLAMALGSILAPATRPLYTKALAEGLLSHHRFIYTVEAKLFFLEMSVDAFLNHDFPGSRTFYSMFLLLDEALRCPSLEAFFPASLDVVTPATPHASNMVTPWGTPYMIRPVGTSRLDHAKPQCNMLERLSKSTLDEDDLLQTLLANPFITCHCLDVENPTSARYKDRNARDDLFPVPLCKKSHPYLLDCARCGAEQATRTGPKFPMCSTCRRVRYCSRECPKADWGRHKTTCERERSSWWGKAGGKAARSETL